MCKQPEICLYIITCGYYYQGGKSIPEILCLWKIATCIFILNLLLFLLLNFEINVPLWYKKIFTQAAHQGYHVNVPANPVETESPYYN